MVLNWIVSLMWLVGQMSSIWLADINQRIAHLQLNASFELQLFSIVVGKWIIFEYLQMISQDNSIGLTIRRRTCILFHLTALISKFWRLFCCDDCLDYGTFDVQQNLITHPFQIQSIVVLTIGNCVNFFRICFEVGSGSKSTRQVLD